MHHVTGVRIVHAMMPSSQGTADMAARPAEGTAVLQEAAMARPEAVRLHGLAAGRRPRAASDKPPPLVSERKGTAAERTELAVGGGSSSGFGVHCVGTIRGSVALLAAHGPVRPEARCVLGLQVMSSRKFKPASHL